MKVVSLGRVPVPTPGTPVQLTTDRSIKAAAIYFAQDSQATGATYVGTSGMVKATRVNAIRVFNVNNSGLCDSVTLGDWKGAKLTLADFWVDADGANQGPIVTYFVT